MSKVFDLSLSAHKLCKFDPVVFAPSHCYGMWYPALPSMSVVPRCAVSALLLLLALSAPVFHDSGLVHSYMSPSTVCRDWKPFQEPPSFTGFLLDGQAAAAWVGLVGMATMSFFGKFMVCSSLAALIVALLVAIVGPAHEFSCEGLAHCFQFVVLLLDAAMLALRVRVGVFSAVHEIFLLAGRTQSKEGSKTFVFKGERYGKVFSQAFCFGSVFLRARVAFGVLLQLCSCIVKFHSAASHCAGSAVAFAFFESSVSKGLGFAAAFVGGFWKEVCMRAAAALFIALVDRFFGSGLFSFLFPGILEEWHVLGLRIRRAARIVEVTMRARQSKPSLRCGHVLGLRMLLDVASSLRADTVLPQMAGSSRRCGFAAPNACDPGVIRRLAAVCARAAFDGVSGVADMMEDHGVVMSVIALPRIKGMQSFRVDAGTRPHIALMAKAEATPRVDVGEVSTTTMVSRGERQNKPAGYQVFARVDGKTLVIQVWEDMLISDLRALIACRLHASPDQCYVTKGGKLLSLMSSVHEVGLVKGSTVELHARGVGGGAVPGEWYCNHCQRGGCWPARSHCFRCGLARSEVGFGKGGKAKGKGGTPPRETSYPGKSSSTAARVQAGKGWSSKPNGENSIPVSISPDVVSQLLNLLQNLGVSQQVMGEIRTKTSQASQKARVVPARTRRVAEMEEKWLESASHLENLREQMTRKEQEYLASMARFEEQEKVVQKLEAEYREAKIGYACTFGSFSCGECR